MGERRAKESISSAALSAMPLARASERARDGGRRAVLARHLTPSFRVSLLSLVGSVLCTAAVGALAAAAHRHRTSLVWSARLSQAKQGTEMLASN